MAIESSEGRGAALADTITASGGSMLDVSYAKHSESSSRAARPEGSRRMGETRTAIRSRGDNNATRPHPAQKHRHTDAHSHREPQRKGQSSRQRQQPERQQRGRGQRHQRRRLEPLPVLAWQRIIDRAQRGIGDASYHSDDDDVAQQEARMAFASYGSGAGAGAQDAEGGASLRAELSRIVDALEAVKNLSPPGVSTSLTPEHALAAARARLVRS